MDKLRLWRACTCAAALAIAAPAYAAPGRAGASEIVVDAGSGRIFHARAADRLRRPASIAKVMTLLLVFDALDNGRLRLDQRLTVSRTAAAQAPVRLGLRAGAAITVRDAMRAVAVKSANDAAVLLAEKLGKDERRFAKLMTAKARAIGMRSTTFGNASGLPDERTWTTARDISILARAIMREHPDRYELFGRRTLVWKRRGYANHNRLLGRVTGVDGIKTGYTNEAGFTLAASAKRAGRRLIAVALGFQSGSTRDDRVGALLEDGFSRIRKQARLRSATGTTKMAKAASQTRSGEGVSDRPSLKSPKARI